MLRKSIAVFASIVLSAGLATSSASAAKPHIAVKAGGACTKVGTVAKIRTVSYVCTKNASTKKLTWVKKVAVKKVAALSPECRDMKVSNDGTKKLYAKALADIATMEGQISAFETAAAAVPGASGDSLRAQAAALRARVAPLKQMILTFGPAVANADAQFKLFC